MSAVVARLDRDEVFWFLLPTTRRYHAFELVQGELEPLSVCGKVEIDVCEDLPPTTPASATGWGARSASRGSCE